MSHSSSTGVNIDFDDADDQQQSPLFAMLPLDIRRHIYLQLWHDYGTTQHIFLFGVKSYLSHYPCLLEKEAFNHQRPPSPAPLDPDHLAEAATEAGVHNVGNHNDQPESQDDPGGIDGAIQDLAAPQPQHPTGASTGFGSAVHNWDDSPWCMHKKCFRAYIELFDLSFERAYSRNYRRAARSASSQVGIIKPLLLCKKMYTEASESLYSKVSFSFPDKMTLERFINDVPRALIERIPAVEIMTNITTDGDSLSWEARSLCLHDASLPPLSTFCTRLKTALSNVQDLRLCIHLTGSSRQHAPRELPDKEWFEPLYHLSSQLSQQKLRNLEIKLVTRCDLSRKSHGESLLTYGSTPEFLKDAPFSVILVPQGWHPDTDCYAYWVN